ncbi:hypothetical protein JK628_16380 [Shewanella sp. KX20019]|uniref:hypothetical protein n=1 Tax=Shewanella sp. KX20019 TaxID=2803864 RepID=UPI0019267C26|nr:hypothetical protein [Shewanella sp. KX20019]QQX79123.1 hypothetical protein JK628_16380 [Shewanella sp. KX20019]
MSRSASFSSYAEEDKPGPTTQGTVTVVGTYTGGDNKPGFGDDGLYGKNGAPDGRGSPDRRGNPDGPGGSVKEPKKEEKEETKEQCVASAKSVGSDCRYLYGQTGVMLLAACAWIGKRTGGTLGTFCGGQVGLTSGKAIEWCNMQEKALITRECN